MAAILEPNAMETNRRHASPHRSTETRSARNKAFVVVNADGVDDFLNRSSCSSLTNDSDLLSSEMEIMMEDLVLFEPPQKEPSMSSKRDTKESGVKRKKKKRKSKKHKAVSYAQLFFDPETKTLVTLMEVNLQDRSSMLQNNHSIEKTKKHRSLPTDKRTFDSEGKLPTTTIPSTVEAESRFQDQTMITECSSSSSETGREGPEKFLYNTESSNLRYSEEPIVFSHNESSQVWTEENDLSFLLHDACDDPWQVSMGKSSVGCTESLKRLLMLRSCVSIRQIGDTKKFRNDCRERVTENVTYAALKDL